MKRFYALLIFSGLAVFVLVIACNRPPVRIPGDMVPEMCELWPGPRKSPNEVTIVLSSPVDPAYAPWARKNSEQLLFRFLYETLIYVDCEGNILPGLAVSWEKSDRGRRWRFELRDNARFWDGTAVTARDVAESWLDAAVQPRTRDAGIDSTVAVENKILEVCFDRRYEAPPRVLAELAFAVTKPPDGSEWPIGSGPYQPGSIPGAPFRSAGRALELIPAHEMRGPVIYFPATSITDARDLMDSGADVTLTADPDVIDYAAGRPELEALPLPWDRTYVLLSTSRARAKRDGTKMGKVPDGLTDRLARDAVRQDARGTVSPYWWKKIKNCSSRQVAVPWLPAVPRGANPSSGVRRILYDSDDPVARDLAERIVALATVSPENSPDARAIGEAIPGLAGSAFGAIADGVAAKDLETSLQEGEDFAYIIQLPSRPADACRELQGLLARAQWLVSLKDDYHEAIVPLVDTRSHAIIDSNRVGLAADYFGVFLLLEEISRGEDTS